MFGNGLFILTLQAFNVCLMAMSTKNILVTGANKGIGKAICKAIIQDHPGTRVLLGSRDPSRGDAAVADIIAELGSEAVSRIESVVIDVGNDESVSTAAASVASRYGCNNALHAIVNNAGVGFGGSVEDTLRTNFFGPMRVNDAFLPLLSADGGRIVNIASSSGPMYLAKCGEAEQKLLSSESATMDTILAHVKEKIASGDSSDAYGFSKACLNAYTMLHAKAHPSLIINSCTPGFIATDLTRGMGATNTPEMGTKSAIYLLFGDDTGSGRYYGSDAIRSPLDRYRGPGDPPYNP